MTLKIGALRTSLLASALLAAAYAHAGTVSTLQVDGEIGDYVSQGRSTSYSGLTATASTDGNMVRIYAENPADYSDYYDITLAAPAGQKLAVGSYLNATRWPFEAPTDPGLTVTAQYRGCNQDFGQFVITGITLNSAGGVDSLQATLEQHCEQLTAPALYATIDIHPDPVTPPPPPPITFSITLDPNGTFSRNGRATLGGSVTCSTNTTATLDGTFTERLTPNKVAQGNFTVYTPCGPNATRFSAEVVSTNGVSFGKGQGQVSVMGQAWDPNLSVNVSATANTVVRLIRK